MDRLTNFDRSLLKYTILPGRPPKGFGNQQFHDRVYSYWREFWSEVYGSSDGVDGDTFLRQDFVPVVTYGTDIVAIHLYTIFNSRALATKDHSYFDTYPQAFFEYLDKQKLHQVMSIESLTVNPEWRKSRTGISFGETMIGCSLKYMDKIPVDAVIAPTRNDRGVNKMCYNFGFDCYAANLDYRGFDIDLVCGIKGKVKPNPSEDINIVIDHLWNSRIDLTGRIGEKSSQGELYGELKEIAI